MIVTRSWLEEWIDLDGISTDELVKTFNSIGLEVAAVDEYNVPKGIVFGHVLECEKHPDADKLNLCKVDVGTGEALQIVCGASNVRKGLDVVVATVGATMPGGLKIKPVKLRGVDSFGMICSAKEIGVADFSEGIVELDSSIGEYKLGEEVSSNKYFSDAVIELELTANRGDCLSIHGVCRDLSAAFNRPLHNFEVKEHEGAKGIGRVLNLAHESLFDVHLSYKAIEVKEFNLPMLIDLRLAQIEEKTSSKIDALLTYTTHATGVILQAYNHSFFAQDEKSVAKIRLEQDEKGYACTVGAAGKASCIGIIQFEESKPKSDEELIFLEASYIAPEIVSKKMYENKIESGSIFYKTSRGSEPELELGLKYALNLLNSYSSSLVYSGTIDLGDAIKPKIVSISKTEIDNFIGAKIDKTVISKILTNLGFDISKSSAENFVVAVPQFRHDIVNKQDIVEEIVRLVGIDNIESKPFVLTEKNRLESDYFTYKKRKIYRERCAANGFFESIHFVFDEKKTLQKYGFETLEESLEILNPIVNTLDTLRPTLMTHLLDSASKNKKNGYNSIKLFEIGSVFSPKREESVKVALIFSGEKEQDSLSNGGKPQMVDFALFTQKVADIVGDFKLQENETSHNLAHPYQSAKIIQDGVAIGELFRVHPNVEVDYDLEATYICEIEFDKLRYELKTAKATSKFQASFRDLSLMVAKDLEYKKIEDAINALEIAELVRFYPVDRYSDEKLGDKVSLSLRFVLQSFEKTLQEEDITSAMDAILEKLKQDLGIELR